MGGSTPTTWQDFYKQSPVPASKQAKPPAAKSPVGGSKKSPNRILTQMNARPANADAKTLQYITSANRLNAQAASLDGKPIFQKHTSAFGKVMDVLSRGMYGTASAAMAGEDASAKNDYQKHGSIVSRLEHGVAAMPHGFMEGVKGKNKATWSEAIQRSQDNKYAHDHHLDPTTTHGKGHVNPVLKYGGGFALDVALDPTTYAGVGLVPKIATKGEKAVKLVEEVGKAKDGLSAAKKSKILSHVSEDLDATQSEARHTVLQNHLNRHVSPNLSDGIHHVDITGTGDDYRGLYKQFPGYGRVFFAHVKDGKITGLLSHSGSKEADTHSILVDVKEAHRGQGIAKQLVDAADKHGLGVSKQIMREASQGTPASMTSSAVHAMFKHLDNSAPTVVRKVKTTKAALATEAAAAKYATADHSASAIEEALGKGVQGGRTVLNETERANHLKKNMPTIQAVIDAHGKAAAQEATRQVYRDAPLGAFVGKKAAKAAAKAEKSAKKEISATLTELLDRNLNPATRKALQVRMFGQHVGSVMAPEVLAKATKRMLSAPPIAASHNIWERGFKSASARLFPAIHQIHRTAEGNAGKILAGHARNLNEVYNVSKADRIRTWQQAANGTFKAGIKGGTDHLSKANKAVPVDNLATHFYDEMGRIGNAITDEGLPLGEINRFLPTSKTSKDDQLLLSHAKHTKGGELDPNWLQHEVLAKWGPKMGEDPAQALYLLRSAYHKAIANRAMHQTIVDTFGVPAKGVLAKGLKAQGYRAVKKKTSALDDALAYHQGTLYHPDIATHIEALHDLTRERKSTSDAMKAFDHATRIFKGTVTKYSPGFHSRNLLGEVMNSHLAGVHDPRVYTKAAKILHRRDSRFLGVGPDAEAEAAKMTRQIQNAANMGSPMKAAADIANPNHIVLSNRIGRTGRPKFTDVNSHGLSADLIYHAFLENGIDSGFIASEFKNTVDPVRGGLLGRAAKGVDNAATHTAQTIENYARLAHFIDAISKSKAPTFAQAAKDAATIVRKYHFDYNDFSNFEKSTMSRVIPFYKWTRKNIPLMAEMLFAEPGKAIQPYKALNNISGAYGFDRNNDSPVPNPEAILPQYLKDAMAIPVGHHGKNTVYENAAIPFGQAFQMFGGGGPHGMSGMPGDTAGNVGQMLSPYLKVPAELLTGNKVGGAPISDKKKYFLGMTPYTNLGQKLVANSNAGPTDGPKGSIFSDPAIMQFLTGLGLAENTPSTIRGAAKQNQTAAIARRKSALKKKGIKGPVKP